MTDQKDIVGISLPLAAGAGAGALLVARCLPGLLYPAGAVALSLVIACGFFSLKYKNLLSVALLFLCTGFFCMLTWQLGTAGTPTPQPGAIVRAGERLRAAVEAIPWPSESSGALVKALTTGDRSALDKETVRIFRSSGAAHLLALSGMHLGIIYLMLTGLLRPLGHGRRARVLRYGVVVCGCGAYALLTGSGPSIVRAALFIFLWETAKLLGRRPDAMRVWCGGLILQLALNPSVITQLGFQLSYLAMAGIFLLFPLLRDGYPSEGRVSDRLNLPRRIWDALALAISCQFFTAPLSWLTFGTFPTYFLLTNLLAMPLTTVLMGCAVSTILLSVLGCCPDMLIQATDTLCQGLIQTLSIIASL